MATHELLIEFQGICTHFRGAVPGVPHRVVFPPTRSYTPGMFETPIDLVPVEYLLEPHLGSIFVQDVEQQIHKIEDVPEVATGWFSTSGLRFRIPNAIDRFLEYPGVDLPPDERPFDVLPRMTDFVKNYRSSDAVLFGSYAQGYFDIYGGSVTAFAYGEALRTRVRMRTEGQPRLEITRLEMQQPGAPQETELPEGTLTVANTSMGCKDGSFDYLWHLSTGQEGIPRYLRQRPYGFTDSGALDREAVAKRFRTLLEHGYPDTLNFDPTCTAMTETQASCSNSQWP